MKSAAGIAQASRRVRRCRHSAAAEGDVSEWPRQDSASRLVGVATDIIIFFHIVAARRSWLALDIQPIKLP
jgi:hypothetical protein